MLYSLDEICLIPNAISEVEHRGDVNVLTNKNNYPIFTAPMASVVDVNNYKTFAEHRLNVIIPRSVDFKDRLSFIGNGVWTALGFKEAELIYEKLDIEDGYTVRICIDQANGHMINLLALCKKFKEKFGDKIKIMTGNIANPYAYREYAKAGVDYIRVGIGSGNVCTTSVQTGMHYPMGSLITKLKEEKDFVKKAADLGAKYLSIPKIIADGGFKRIDQCVKALALGADFVMLGEILAKSEEACGEIVAERNKYGFKSREYFGMSTEKAQILVNDASFFKVEDFTPKHTEGQVKNVDVEYKLSEWLGDFDHALRSSMSYAGAKCLDQFIGKVNWETMSPVTYKAYMK